jgi:hypothetical protein
LAVAVQLLCILIMNGSILMSPRLVAMAFRRILMLLTVAVVGQHGRLLVCSRRSSVRATGFQMPFRGRCVGTAGPLQRLLGPAPGTLDALRVRRQAPRQFVATLPQLFCPRARRLGARLGVGVVGVGVLAGGGHRFLHETSSYA